MIELQIKRPPVPVFVATTFLLSFISFWRAAAIVLSDLASSAYYVDGPCGTDIALHRTDKARMESAAEYPLGSGPRTAAGNHSHRNGALPCCSGQFLHQMRGEDRRRLGEMRRKAGKTTKQSSISNKLYSTIQIFRRHNSAWRLCCLRKTSPKKRCCMHSGPWPSIPKMKWVGTAWQKSSGVLVTSQNNRKHWQSSGGYTIWQISKRIRAGLFSTRGNETRSRPQSISVVFCG